METTFEEMILKVAQQEYETTHGPSDPTYPTSWEDATVPKRAQYIGSTKRIMEWTFSAIADAAYVQDEEDPMTQMFITMRNKVRFCEVK